MSTGDRSTGTRGDTDEARTAQERPSADPSAERKQTVPHSGDRLGVIFAVADVVVPIGGYYVLRACGLGELDTLLITSVVPLLSFVVQGVAFRRVDGFAIFIAAVLILNAAAALTTMDPRTLLARDGWIMGLTGLYFLSTLWAKRPICYSIARPLAEGRLGPPGMSWETVWETDPRFRRVWRVITIVWGVGLLADAAIRIVVAYTLPVDWVPVITGIQYVLVFVALQAITQIFLRRSGMTRLPGFKLSRRKTTATR
ncbi:MAG TPA: VC0807 family protein [Pseudonocardia sp.]|jgi:hypothetical protein|nr:VC0807 family protein [Pseudonocardia sp.]